MRASYVYLIRHGRIHKIGNSLYPQARLWQVVPAGADGELVHFFPARHALQVERTLHRRFAAQRLHGEWFSLEQADVDLICQVRRADSADDLPPALQSPAPRLLALYAEIPAELMDRLRNLAARRGRTLRAEYAILLGCYLDAEEAAEGLPPLEEAE